MSRESPRDEQPFTGRLADWLVRHARLVWLVIVGLYLLGLSRHWRIGADSALYLSIGRNLAEGTGYTYHGQPHNLVYPLLPWLIGGVWRLTYIGDILTLNLLMLACHLGALALFYRAVALRLDRASALVTVLLTAVAASVFPFAFQILTDPPFFLGVAALLAGYEGWCRDLSDRSRNVQWMHLIGNMALFVVGLAVAMFARPTALAIVGALLLTAGWALWRGPFRARHCVAGVAAIAVVGAFMLLDPREPPASYRESVSDAYMNTQVERLSAPMRFLDRLLTEAGPQWFDAHANEALLGIDLGPGFSWLMGALVIGMGVGLFKWRFLWGAMFIMTATMLLATQPVVRYFLPVTPLLAVAWWQMARWIDHRGRKPYGAIAAALMLVLWFGGNLGETVIDYIIEQRQITGELATYPDPKYRRLAGVVETMNAIDAIELYKTRPTLIAPAPRELTFKTNWRVVRPSRRPTHGPVDEPLFALMPPAKDSPLIGEHGRWKLGKGVARFHFKDGEQEKHWRLHILRQKSNQASAHD